MKLVFFRGKVPNFGDELNLHVWPALLPKGFLDEDDSELFVGIGSIIGNNLNPKSRKYVMGSGYAGYMGLPDVHDGTWDIRFLRGPNTARTLKVDPKLSVCDSAVLLRAMELPAPEKSTGIAFMPHYESLERGDWAGACEMAGITLIDATEPVSKVLSQIRGAKLLITEAMHGAIVADALRTPWIGAKPIYGGHHRKWLDWSGALDLDVRLNELKPTSVLEYYIGRTNRGGELGKVGKFNRSALATIPNRILTASAARHLQKMAKLEPQLSSDAKIAEVTERALAAVDGFVRERQAVA
ncbi:MAG: polysaccharide pyruvyl transferase family protein [Candidatus Devosia phytovorans]|uniref:Polysaccharide pyruvyl transferase family protein n=1 Tax=Candidatus Devosia phytovorans TaxID=3121372 RepID=A0AAJ5VVR4_9HYPH|nr:polysaccharide pyruvyl transferase family protein [Devosia sp.]WEK05803.1 MAG: polysaccharide pyruvyl transferase family protein [Devosia sp.]